MDLAGPRDPADGVLPVDKQPFGQRFPSGALVRAPERHDRVRLARERRLVRRDARYPRRSVEDGSNPRHEGQRPLPNAVSYHGTIIGRGDRPAQGRPESPIRGPRHSVAGATLHPGFKTDLSVDHEQAAERALSLGVAERHSCCHTDWPSLRCRPEHDANDQAILLFVRQRVTAPYT